MKNNIILGMIVFVRRYKASDASSIINWENGIVAAYDGTTALDLYSVIFPDGGRGFYINEEIEPVTVIVSAVKEMVEI